MSSHSRFSKRLYLPHMATRRIISLSPREDVWAHLKGRCTYESLVDVVCLDDDSTIDRVVSVVGHVGSLVRQGEEYFRLAQTSTLMTKPVPLYYGMLALVKALTLWYRALTSKDLQLPSNHGLTIHTPQQELDGDETWPTEYQAASWVRFAKTGAAADLLHATGHSVVPPKPLHLMDLVLQTPELTELDINPYRTPALMYIRVCGKEGMLVYADEHRHTLGRTEEAVEAFIADVDPGCARDDLKCLRVRPSRSLDEFTWTWSLLWGESNWLVGPLYGGDDHHYWPEHDERSVDAIGVVLPEVVTQLAAVFVLATVARYSPEIWLWFVDGHQGSEYTVVDTFLRVAERKFPNMVLDYICDEHFSFGAATAPVFPAEGY